MKLKHLLTLQILYAALGVGYNVVSHFVTAGGGKALSSTAPLVGGLSLGIYALCLLPGFLGKITPYRILMGLAILVFGYGGIIKHLLNYPDGLAQYASMTAYVVAVAINVYGLALNILAAAGRFKRK